MPALCRDLLTQRCWRDCSTAIERELPRAVELRHRLHAHPELAHAEQRTAASVAAELPVACRAVAGTGRIARVEEPARRAPRRPVAVRAELDGLPIARAHGRPVQRRGRGDARVRARRPHGRAGRADARGARARRRAAGAAARGLPAERGGLSVGRRAARRAASSRRSRRRRSSRRTCTRSWRWGAVALDAGAVNASCDAVEITVEGEPSHGAYPHRGRDPILALAQVVVALHAQVGRRIDPLRPGVADGRRARGRQRRERDPGARAGARGAARPPPEDRARAARRWSRRSWRGSRRRTAAAATVELVPGEPALENDAAIVAARARAARRRRLAHGREWRSCGSDDFAFFGALAPIAMAFVGLDGAEGFTARPLHHPELLAGRGGRGGRAHAGRSVRGGGELGGGTRIRDRGAVTDRSALDHPTRRPDHEGRPPCGRSPSRRPAGRRASA